MIEGVPDRFVGDHGRADRYRIVRELGRGGMGVVYLGRDLRLDMDVAIKFHGVTHGDATLWLKREFRAVAPLRHPNLVELYELVAHERSCYFTMEYLEGVDPRRWVEREPEPGSSPVALLSDHTTRTVVPLQEAHTETSGDAPASVGSVIVMPMRARPTIDHQRVRDVVTQLAQGLAYLHARGVIHRDVKPSNAIVVDGGIVKLLDFGLALSRWQVAEEEGNDTTVPRDTHIVGTVAYLAPEYLQRLVVTPALDIYALGVLAYELVTGTPPFGGALQFLGVHRAGVAPRARVRYPDLPVDLDDAIAAMLSLDPDARPTASELVERLTGTRSRPGHERRREIRFVGREAERARLGALIADPRPRARLGLVTGASGVGKTALVDEVAARARGDATVVWRGRCHERERVPYRAFDLIVDDLATELGGDPSVARVVPHLGALARVFPSLAPLLDPLIASSDEPAADLRVERERALLAMTQLLSHLVANDAGVVLVIDDLQWADDDSLELLALIVERVDRPLTVIASWTIDEHHAHTAPSAALAALRDRLGDAVSTIEVPVMSEAELVAVIAALAPGTPGDRLVEAARLAAGNPYLAELIGRELGDTAATELGATGSAEQRRLARLTTDERTVTEIASLAGGVATFEQLKALAELPSVTLQSVLRGLEDGRVVRAAPSPTGVPVYLFYHQRLRAAAHDAMADARRLGLHARYADWLERADGTPDQIEYHWREAGDRPRAARWAIAAAEAARTQLAWAIAADGYARALELGAPDPRTARESRAECLFLGGKLADAARAFLALARESDSTRGDHWRVRAAEAYLKLGELDRGLGVIDDVLARRGEGRSPHRTVSVLRAALVGVRWLAPLPRRAQPVDDVLAAAYRAIASFLSTPYPIEALEYVLRGVALAERSGDLAAHSMGLSMLGAYLAAGTLGRFGDRALAHAQRLAAESGAPYAEMVAAGCAGILEMLRGDWTSMRRAHQLGEQICTRLGLERSWEASFFAQYRALGEYFAGDPARALALLKTDDRSEDMFSRAMLGSSRGRAFLLAGELPSARAALAALRETPAARQGMPALYHQLFAAELALAEHDWTRAGRLADRLADFARAEWLSLMPAVGAMVDVTIATAAIGRAHAGDRAAADLALTTAKRLYRRGGASFYGVTALRLWSQAETLRGHPRRAHAALERARASASRGGALDRLAIAALSGERIDPGPLEAALVWSTGGVVTV